MPNYTSYKTPEVMRSAKPADVVTQVAAYFGKKTLAELIRFSFDANIVSETTLTPGPNGPVLYETVTRDIATDALLGTKRLEYSYYEDEPRRPIKDIVTKTLNPLGVETSKKTLRHFTMGEYPQVIKEPVEVPIGV